MIDLNKRNQYLFIAFQEPFQEADKITKHKEKLRIQNAMSNRSGKYGFFGIVNGNIK